jgi:hypothetical protein
MNPQNSLKRKALVTHHGAMRSFPFPPALCFTIASLLAASVVVAAPQHRDAGTPLPKEYAALLARARAGTLQVIHGEAGPTPTLLERKAAPHVAGTPDIFPPTSFRATAKTSFAPGTLETFSTLDSLFAPLPKDSKMTQQFPPLVGGAGNNTPRVAPEKRNVKVLAWIYWVNNETDQDFHVILGSTSQLTTATIFMNSEVSGLPAAHPTQSPFPKDRADIRAILAKHPNANGLFVTPVPVTVFGSLLWDGEHRFPNNVGPKKLRPTKAWEIHPIKQLAER